MKFVNPLEGNSDSLVIPKFVDVRDPDHGTMEIATCRQQRATFGICRRWYVNDSAVLNDLPYHRL